MPVPIGAMLEVTSPQDFADWLADEGIVSISLNPDSVVDTWQRLAKRGIGSAAIR